MEKGVIFQHPPVVFLARRSTRLRPRRGGEAQGETRPAERRAPRSQHDPDEGAAKVRNAAWRREVFDDFRCQEIRELRTYAQTRLRFFFLVQQLHLKNNFRFNIEISSWSLHKSMKLCL